MILICRDVKLTMLSLLYSDANINRVVSDGGSALRCEKSSVGGKCILPRLAATSVKRAKERKKMFNCNEVRNYSVDRLSSPSKTNLSKLYSTSVTWFLAVTDKSENRVSRDIYHRSRALRRDTSSQGPHICLRRGVWLSMRLW